MLILLLASWTIILTYWFWFYKSFRKTLDRTIHDEKIKDGVSVVVCYKNEANHIVQTIRAVLNQKYPLFEVIAMNDFSADGSKNLVEEITDVRLRCFNVKENRPGKKQAVEEAVRVARYNHILLTDADCVPCSDQWIQHMVSGFEVASHPEVVLGFAPLYARKNFLTHFQRYETILTAMQYVSYALSGIPYMGVGRNLMYTKGIFLRSGGMKDLMITASGDDDLLVSKMSPQTNVGVVLHPESFVFSKGKKSWKAFLLQKTRHISTSVYYKTQHKILLAAFAMSQVGFYTLLITSLATERIQVIHASILLLTKWGIQQIMHKEIFRRLKHQELFCSFPLLDITMTIYYVVLPWFAFFRNKKW